MKTFQMQLLKTLLIKPFLFDCRHVFDGLSKNVDQIFERIYIVVHLVKDFEASNHAYNILNLNTTRQTFGFESLFLFCEFSDFSYLLYVTVTVLVFESSFDLRMTVTLTISSFAEYSILYDGLACHFKWTLKDERPSLRCFHH